MNKLDPRTTALVLIDLQKGILGRDWQPRNSADVLTAATNVARHFRAKGAVVVQVHVGFAPDFSDAPRQPVDMPMRSPDGHPPDFMDFPEGLVAPTDIVIHKRQWGAFYGTDLDLQLRRRGVQTIVLGGIATNIGVESTARDAWERGYNLIFAEQLMATFSTEMHDFAVRHILPRIGVMATNGDLLANL